jgi:hexosaminidase
MIDSTDHYMSIELIKKTINAMMFLKLNVLHWHIVDDVSFPLFIPEIPELSEYGQLSGIYSVQDVK